MDRISRRKLLALAASYGAPLATRTAAARPSRMRWQERRDLYPHFANKLEVEFVCIPRPIENNAREEGGPLAYRVTHRVSSWKPGSGPAWTGLRKKARFRLCFDYFCRSAPSDFSISASALVN